MMLIDGGRRPDSVLVGMAGSAGIGRAQRHTLIGSWNTERVIMAGIDAHVDFRRHMTGRALGTGAAGGMLGMHRRIVFRGLMALGTDRIAIGFQFPGMRIMAITAGDALGVHFALHE